MNFLQAVAAGFSNYAGFSGRAIRSEFWYWFLFYVVVVIATVALDFVIGIQLTSSIFGIVALVPTLAMQVRRLHDLDRSGWWIFLNYIPLVGSIILIVWYCRRGTVGPNRFGGDPLAGVDLGATAGRIAPA